MTQSIHAAEHRDVSTIYILNKKIEHDERIEKVPRESQAGLNESNLPSYRDAEIRRVPRKVDYRLIPMLTLLYVLGFLDRGNIGNAKVAGMNQDLSLQSLIVFSLQVLINPDFSSKQYNLALTVFFLPYAIFEVPSNIVLKLLRPSIWICIMMTSWGIVMTFQGLVKNYHHLVVTRTLLGFTEAGFFPAATYLLTTCLAGAFSGLLAFAIEKMHGIGGLEGWRWIFILEGIVTVLVGCTVPWTLPDSPERASFLTLEEKAFIARRLEADAGTSAGKVKSGEKFQWRFLRAALTEWKIYFAMIAYWGNSVCLYAFTYSAPSIILQLGYTASNAQLLTIPIYLLGVVSTIVFSRMADKREARWPFIVAPFGIALCGFIGLLSIPHPRYPGLTYAFLFAIPAGVYPPLIGILAWAGNNLAPSWKRAVGMALLISLGNFGGAIGSNVFIESQKPRYPLGYGFCLGIVTAAIMCTVVLKTSWSRLNKQRDTISDDEIREKYTDEELLDMGDKSPRYRYVI